MHDRGSSRGPSPDGNERRCGERSDDRTDPTAPPYDDGSHSYDGGVFDTVAEAFEAGDTAMRRSDDAPGWFEVVVTRVGFTPDYNIRS